MSSASSGDTCTPAAARSTVCSSSPSGPVTGTTSTSASPAPATAVTDPLSPPGPPLTPVTGSPGAVVSGTTNAPVSSPWASAETARVSPARSSATVARTALDKNGTGATARPISSMTTAASRALAPAPAERLGNQQAGHAQFSGQRPPHARELLGLGVIHAGHRFGRATLGEELTDPGPQRLFGVRVQQVTGRRAKGAHRGRSFHAASLSTRCSPGRPRIRSEMVLRRISDVPPSIELPRARR